MKSARPSCTASRTLAPMKKAVWRKRSRSPGATYGRRAQGEQVDDLLVRQRRARRSPSRDQAAGSAAPEPTSTRLPERGLPHRFVGSRACSPVAQLPVVAPVRAIYGTWTPSLDAPAGGGSGASAGPARCVAPGHRSRQTLLGRLHRWRRPSRWFNDIGLEDLHSVGGKGANLGELTRAGCRCRRALWSPRRRSSLRWTTAGSREDAGDAACRAPTPTPPPR